jgi:hypothetical protein
LNVLFDFKERCLWHALFLIVFTNIMSKIELAMDCWTRKEYDLDLIPSKNMSHLWSGKRVLQIWKVGGQELQSIGGIDLPLTWFGSVP